MRWTRPSVEPSWRPLGAPDVRRSSATTCIRAEGQLRQLSAPVGTVVAAAVVVGLLVDDVEVVVELDLDVATALDDDLDAVGATVVGVLGLRDPPAAGGVERRGHGLVAGRAAQRPAVVGSVVGTGHGHARAGADQGDCEP